MNKKCIFFATILLVLTGCGGSGDDLTETDAITDTLTGAIIESSSAELTDRLSVDANASYVDSEVYVNRNSGFCMTSVTPENGAHIKQRYCDVNDYGNQFVYELVEGTDMWYFLKLAEDTDYCVDVAAWSEAVGGKLHVWKCHGGKNQQFGFYNRDSNTDNTYLIQARHSRLCLGLDEDNEEREDQRVLQRECTGWDRALWWDQEL